VSLQYHADQPVGAGLPAIAVGQALISLTQKPSLASQLLQGSSLLTVTKSERLHVSKSAFSICNRTLSLRPLPAETLLLLTSRLLLSAYPPEKDQELRLYA
jgi:hypothetical protein